MSDFNYDMISRYLDGDLNGEERKAFEKQMQEDVELRKEVELVREVEAALTTKLYPAEGETALRNTLEGLNAEFFANRPERAKVIPLRNKRWLTAIAAIFIMALILTVWQPWKDEDLYQQYAAIQMPGIAERGAAADSILKIAVENFNSKNYSSAIPGFETILKDSAQNTFVQFFYAVALLQNGNLEKARLELTAIYNGPSLFKYDAAFYLALSYLKADDKITCRGWLNKIPADAGIYDRAQELLKKL